MRIKEVLKEHGITQVELAEKLGINRVNLSNMLSEKNDMRVSTLLKLADAIGCKPQEFFGEVSDEDFESSSAKLKCPHCGKDITVKIQQP